MLRITGYTDRWTVAGGEEVRLCLSSSAETVHWQILRHLGPIEGPSHWIERCRPVAGLSGRIANPGEREIVAGSFFETDISVHEQGSVYELSFAVFPTLIQGPSQIIAQLVFEFGEITLLAGASGEIAFQTASGARVSCNDVRLQERRWQRLEFVYDRTMGSAEVTCIGAFTSSARAALRNIPTTGRYLVGLRLAGDGSRGCFDGKIEGPQLRVGDDGQWKEIGQWNFGLHGEEPFVVPNVCGGRPGFLRNTPTRAVTSSAYDGRVCSFLDAPEMYNAVWFHRDDLGDAGWPVSETIRLPDLGSGAYSIVVSETEQVEWAKRESFDALPLFVRPSRDSRKPVALVLPTFSYRAYANNTFAEDADPRIFQKKRSTASKPLYDYAIAQNLLSLYSLHRDGSGVCLSTLLRPQVTIRADFDSQLQGFPHQFSADLAILGWLEGEGVDYDILTDELLHEQGDELLHYGVVLTGSHPEYSSGKILDAYDDYVRSGGHLMYLGGNGFYWAVGQHSRHPELLEVRRSEGTRTWTCGIGERRQQLDGADGGLWRSLGRPPNSTFGIGFCAHGFSGDGRYMINPDAELPVALPRTKAVIKDLAKGEFGVAGLELDRYAPEFGSPVDSIVIASTSNMPAGYLPTVEEFGGLDDLIVDAYGVLASKVRGDIVMRPTAAGGYVFSVGSIRWTSGLRSEHDDYSVRALTSAVLGDFLDLSANGRRH